MVTKKKTKFFKSLRFRILVILLILGIVPSAIVTQLMISNYEKQAIEVKVSEVSTQCAILCNQIIKENYLNDSSSQSVNSKLELLSNVYGGRMVIVDRDLKVVADTYHVDEGRTLISPKVVKCFKNGEVTNYRRYGQMLEMAVPVKSADVPQIQGAMLVNISISDIMATVGEQEQMAMLLTGIIVALSVLLAYGLSTILVKPLASVTKSIEDLTDGYQKDEISVPDYTETELITDAFNKMLARMKVLDESRSEFVSNVSHELKTPMTSMKVLADSLVGQEGVPEELYQEFMRDITAEIDRENRIITDLLTLVKMDKKSADLQISHMDINQLLEDILKRLRPIADKRNIDLILDSFRPVEADVDELKFTSAISNLVENAIKYNVDDGWVRVSLDADHKFFYVTVADSGMGIPEDSIDRIFERFYRVDKSHSREIGGTGLGLAICQMIVEKMGGAITVESELHEGSTFRFTIPYDMYNMQEKFKKNAEREQHLKVAIRSLQLRTLLVAEDVDSNFLLMNTVLGKKYKLIRARDGREAVDMYKENHPDLIFMDIKMPYMDGLEATRLIRGYSKDIPIIALTAFAFESDRERAIEAGCNDYLTKPISQEAIEKILDKYSL